MPHNVWTRLLVAVAAIAAAAPAAEAQDPAAGQPPATVVRVDEPSLVFEREVFNYSGRVRRDPFRPLTTSSSGPLFGELSLQMIIFVDNPAESVAMISDATNRRYRVRRGDTVGNATVIDIGPTRVVFSVNDFGMRRQEVLNLKPTQEGAGR